MGPLGPFWTKSNEAKRIQPPAPTARWVPNHKWAHLSQFLALNLNSPKNGEKDPRTQINQEPKSGHSQPLASGSHQLKFSKLLPPFRRRNLLHQCTLYQGVRHGAYMV
ncbi:hypothetical protein O181_050434 [Austropuccinia psidii MF-1]|uniref:Uncharacterized protein n=1 Tax=Austropuccinia psidii MF-1 TaxID=1389203 RepID=A0A9Q3DWU6_9BASI|nr:hypothetical protein [Austropuccinia psidii MF-1]